MNKSLFLGLVCLCFANCTLAEVSHTGKVRARYVSDERVGSLSPDEVLLKVAKADKRVGIHRGIQDPKVCKEAKEHSDWLAAKNLPAHLPSWAIAHHGESARSNNLIGNMVGSRGFRANKFSEIVSEALPTDDMEKAAQDCIDGWYNSPSHKTVLIDPSAKWSCLTMSRSKNPNNPRWYCVGLALYYQ